MFWAIFCDKKLFHGWIVWINFSKPVIDPFHLNNFFLIPNKNIIFQPRVSEVTSSTIQYKLHAKKNYMKNIILLEQTYMYLKIGGKYYFLLTDDMHCIFECITD